MGTPYVGEIRCVGFNFAPYGWALCNGQIMAISDNETLYSLLGTIYGGDGVNTFNLPDLRSRAPMHWGNGLSGFNTVIGQVQGTESVTLSTQQIPAHTHTVTAQIVQPGGAPERVATPTSSAYLGPSNPDGLYNSAPTLNTNFSSKTIGNSGGSQPHENRQPYLAVSFIIALFGIYPSRN